jgi:hypothetical protein
MIHWKKQAHYLLPIEIVCGEMRREKHEEVRGSEDKTPTIKKLIVFPAGVDEPGESGERA